METTQKTTRLHPLLTAAAISVTVFSAVGVGAMTGLLPHSFGSAGKAAAPIVSEAPVVDDRQPVESKTAAMPPAAPKATPKPAKKAVVAKAPAYPSGPAPVQDFGESPRVAQAPVATEAPKTVPAGVLGTVAAVRELKTPAEKSNGLGPIAGGIGGAVLGSTIGKDMGGKNTRSVMTVLGAAAGAFGGREIERHARATKHWEIDVRLDDGTQRTLSSDAQPYWQPGHRVRVLDGRLQPV